MEGGNDWLHPELLSLAHVQNGDSSFLYHFHEPASYDEFSLEMGVAPYLLISERTRRKTEERLRRELAKFTDRQDLLRDPGHREAAARLNRPIKVIDAPCAGSYTLYRLR